MSNQTHEIAVMFAEVRAQQVAIIERTDEFREQQAENMRMLNGLDERVRDLQVRAGELTGSGLPQRVHALEDRVRKNEITLGRHAMLSGGVGALIATVVIGYGKKLLGL